MHDCQSLVSTTQFGVALKEVCCGMSKQSDKDRLGLANMKRLKEQSDKDSSGMSKQSDKDRHGLANMTWHELCYK